MDDPVTLDPGAAENGLACMLADLVRQNLVQHPERRRDFDALSGRVVIDARDIEVRVTLEFERGRLTVLDGERPEPVLRIEADHDTILELTMLGSRFGLPDLLDEKGRTFVMKLL